MDWLTTATIDIHLGVYNRYQLHLAGKNNVVADCLPRAVIDNVSMGTDYTAMAKAQVPSEEIQAYRSAITSLKLADSDSPVSETDLVLLYDVSTGTPHYIVPIQY